MEHANRMKPEAQEQTKKDADGQQRVATMVDYGILGIALGSSSSSCCYCKLAFYHWLFLNIQQICYRCGFFAAFSLFLIRSLFEFTNSKWGLFV